MSRAYGDLVPDYAIPPGETIRETLAALGMTQAELALRMGRPENRVSEIINGKRAVTPETALQLERVLGVPARMWNNLEANYREALARLAEQERIEGLAQQAGQFPYAEMAKRGWVPETRNATERTSNLLSFFGVESFTVIRDVHAAAYRTARGRKPDPPALAAWLRKGELEARNMETQNYDETALRGALPTLRALTPLGPVEFLPRLKTICAQCGVAVVVVPRLPRTYVNGTTRWLNPIRALVQLTVRGRFIDIFRFSFFHEIGHILLHGKRQEFIDTEDAAGTKEEAEADEFAAAALLSTDEYARARALAPDFTPRAVTDLAKELRLAPAIIVGRLQHDGVLRHDQLNHLRPRLEWVAAE